MNIDTQAERIGFALIRIAAYVRRSGLRRRIEESAFELVESASNPNPQQFLDMAPSLEALVRIGKAIYEIEPINADMVISDIASLKSEIRQIAELSLPPRNDYQLKGGLKGIEEDIAQVKEEVEVAKRVEKPEKRQSENGDNAAIRQSAIVDRIRAFGNKPVQLKDIIAEFPKVSERTLRYDIQRLCNQGVIERIGQGGPGTFYRARVI